MKPTNETELLLAYVDAKITLVWEFSGNSRQNLSHITEWANNYANTNNIPISFHFDEETLDITHQEKTNE
jgi:hypothetical protein